MFSTTEALVAADNDGGASDLYLRSSGVTTLVAGGTAAAAPTLGGFSGDGSRYFISTAASLAAADTDAALDLYEVGAGGPVLVSVNEGGAGGYGGALAFNGASADGSHAFFTTYERLAPGDTDLDFDTYDRYGGHTSLITTGPAGGNGNFTPSFAAASADGSKAFFDSYETLVAPDMNAGGADVYERGGSTTKLVSAPQPASGHAGYQALGNSFFGGLSTDGAKVVFTTNQNLTSDDRDGGWADLYTRAGGVTTRVSTGATDSGETGTAILAGLTPDADAIVFATTQGLVGGDNDNVNDLYVADAGGTRLVSAADTQPPETTITSGPPANTDDPTPTFSFTSDDPGSNFECRVDSEPFAPCTDPGGQHTTDPLAPGAHTFQVRAVDSAGNVDPSPAERTFSVSEPPTNLSLPPGFQDSAVISGVPGPTVVRFAGDGRVFVAEKRGIIDVFDGLNDPTPAVLADLRPEVFNDGDRGLLGMQLDPQFPSRPYVYVLYTYNAEIGGTAPRWPDNPNGYDTCPNPPGAELDGCVVSGRLSRLRVSGEQLVDERVLVEDWCQQFPSHSMGDIAFDSTGALLAGGGDGASYNDADYGQFGSPLNPCGDPPTGVGGTQNPPSAEGGALRSQDRLTTGDPQSLDGSIIRVDPDTGAGLPDNPLASSADPNARRLYAYGFRNPFRMDFQPGTDELWVGDVGWSAVDELNVIHESPSIATNFGWPCYEGSGRDREFDALNLNLCEGLYNSPGAVTPPVFPMLQGQSYYPSDPCDPAPGTAISGVRFYDGVDFPAAYDDALFLADAARGCMWSMRTGPDGAPDPSTIQSFGTGLDSPVDIEVGPDGSLYYPSVYDNAIHRIGYSSGNQPPISRLSANPPYGPLPLTVGFDASGSSDGDGDPLTYAWDLDGDGNFDDATTPTASRTYSNPVNRKVSVRVSDPSGATSIRQLTVYPGDTPPVPVVAAPDSALEYNSGDQIDFSGQADDTEQGTLPDSSLDWRLRIEHCQVACHQHPLGDFFGVAGGTFTAPSHQPPSHISISFTATDDRGLTATTTVQIFPSNQVPPQTSISVSPGVINDTTPTFTFVSDQPGSTFECGVDGAPFASCSGPGNTHTTQALSDGTHTFAVRALGPGGIPDSTPATWQFMVDTVAPLTEILVGPARDTPDNTPTFELGPQGAGFGYECRVDGGRFAACSGPSNTHTTPRLADGFHLFEAKSTDAAGNRDPDSALRVFDVDTRAPQTLMRSLGVDAERRRIVMRFRSTERRSSYRCTIDGRRLGRCRSPLVVRHVSPGRHRLAVRAVDAVGNPDPTPVRRLVRLRGPGRGS